MAVNTYSKANGQSNTRRGVRYERIVDGNGRRFIRTRNGGDVDHWSLSPRTSARAATPSDGPSSLLGRDASPTLTAPYPRPPIRNAGQTEPARNPAGC